MSRRLNFRDARDIQRRRGSEDDAKGDDVRECHAEVGIDLDPAQVICRAFRRVGERSGGRVGVELLDLLRRLPEKKIRADGGTEDRDHDGQILRGQREMRRNGAGRDFAPRNVDGKHQDDVGKEREG